MPGLPSLSEPGFPCTAIRITAGVSPSCPFRVSGRPEAPRLVRWFLAWVEFLATPRIRGTLRWALGEQGEIRA
jgi:hypothetical protein